MPEQTEKTGKPIGLDDLNEGMTWDEVNQGPPPSPEPSVQTQTEPQEPAPEPTPSPEPVVEPQAQVQEPEKEPAPQPEISPQIDIAALNKFFEKSYESLDQVKADLEKPTMESEYQEQKTAYEELQAKYNDLNENYTLLTEQADPSTYFSSEEAMKLEVFKKQHPKKDASIATKVFSTQDLSSIDDLEVVKMGRKFKSSKPLPGTDADLETAILEELGLDPETPRGEWSNSAQIRLATMAEEYREAFDQMKSSVTLPERVDIAKLKADRQQAKEAADKALNEGWGKIAEEAVKQTNKLEVPVGAPKEGEEQQFFKWDLGKAPQEEVDQLKQDYISLGLNPDSEARESFQEALKLTLLQKNLNQIMEKFRDDALARQKEEFLKQTHNPNPLTDSQRVEPGEKEKLIKERTAFAIGGLGPALHGNPLFSINK